MRSAFRCICLFLALAVMLGGLAYGGQSPAQVDQEEYARGIFQLEQGDGYALDILLKRPANDVWLSVPPDTVFHNGDQVKLGLRGNFDGYLYIVNIGTSGTRRIMVPSPSVPENHLQKGVYKQFLVGELAGEPGEEVLYIVSAPTKILEFERAIAENKGVLSMPIPAKTEEPIAEPSTKPTITTKTTSEPVINQPVSSKKKSKIGILKSVGAQAVKILGIFSLFSREVESEYSSDDSRSYIASKQGRLKGGEFLAFELTLRHER